MKTLKARLSRPILLLVSVPTLLVLAFCRADAASSPLTPAGASGPITIAFTNSMAPVFDLTGSYRFQHQLSLAGAAPIDVTLVCSLAQDASGRLRGSGTTNIQVGAELLPVKYSVSGKVTGGGEKATRVSLQARWEGQGADALNVAFQYNLVATPGYLDGFARGKARFGRGVAASIKSPVADVPLPVGVDGSWQIAMNLQPPGGTASIVLPRGRKLQVNPAVSISRNSGRERVKLTCTGADRGTMLTVNLLPSSGTLESVSGKVLGQAVSIKAGRSVSMSQVAAVANVSSGYAGYQACLECHTPVQQTVSLTRHAQVGVQCEDCHGPAANHAANDYDPQSRPVIPYDGKTCGACHSGPRHPVYEEWQESGHAEVAIDLNPPDRTSSCGRCHSGSVHVSLVDGAPLPVGDKNVPLGCPTCHQPHALTGQPAQLRNPLFSTNDYFLTTSSVFSNSYNPNVNLCAQCHNHRGASVASTSRPPHESPQYNILLGSVGVLASGSTTPYDPAYHALFITNQCVGCHMQQSPQVGASPAVTGHEFNVNSYAACAGCHGSAVIASNTVVFWSGYISNRIVQLHGSLDQWATNDAPAVLSVKYGTRAWEYTTPGALSPGGPGPDAAEQGQIPQVIKNARFNLYLVLYDGSVGVHNPRHSLNLLDAAQAWVDQETSP